MRYFLLTLIITFSALNAADKSEKKVEETKTRFDTQLKSINSDGVYLNYRKFGMMEKGAFWPMMKEWWGSDNIKEPKENLEVKLIDPDTIFTGDSTGLRATWLGHSSFIIEIDGLRLLLDPVLSSNISPVPWIYPVKRFQKKPPIAPESLPKVDAVIISHDHADHLDKKQSEIFTQSEALYRAQGN